MKGKKMTGLKFILNPTSAKYLDNYTTWLSDGLVMRGLGWSEPADATTLKKWLKQSGNTSTTAVRFEIIEKATKKPVGFCMIHDIDDVVSSGKVAVYMCDPVYRYRGFGNEALNLLVKYALFELKLHSLWCEVPSYNSAALSLFKKQGFTECGTRHHAGKLGDEYYNITTFEIINQNF